MTTQHNPDEIARLIARARKRYASFGAVATADSLAMADQLEAAQAEIERWKDEEHRQRGIAIKEHENADRFAKLWNHDVKAVESVLNERTAERDKLQAENERLRNTDIGDALVDYDNACAERDRLQAELESASKDAEHWREARRVALEGGEILKAELEAARREVERLAAYEREYGDAALLLNSLRVPLKADGKHLTMIERIDAYRAARDKVGG